VYLATAVLALVLILAAASSIAGLQGVAFAWPVLGLAAFPAAASVLLVLRHGYAEAFLRLTAMCWTPLGPAYLLAAILGPTDASLPDWAFPATVAAFVAGATSIVGLWAGSRHLRSIGVRPRGIRPG